MGKISDELKEYSRKVLDHFHNPRNTGDLKDATIVTSVENTKCGDVIKLYLKIKDNSIMDAKMKTFGCTASIASASVLTELLKGKSIRDAQKLKYTDIVNALDGLPERKIDCAKVAEQVTRSAVEKFLAKPI